jgi:riboflavin biosynthesis pyrimidine reductase
MKHRKPLERHKLLRKSRRLSEISRMTDVERARHRSELIAKGVETVKELDPIVRETYKDDPEKLAEWEDIMRMMDDPEAETKE